MTDSDAEFTGKALALFLDGTWDTSVENTNVWRAKSLCDNKTQAGRPQIIYYSVGVGTSIGEEVRGGVLGYGVNRTVREAYQWLVDNYADGDRIYLFGFSRGAFEARGLAGLISHFGLLKRGCPLSVSQLFERYKLGFNARFLATVINALEGGETLSVEDKWLHKYSREINIHFIGVWDTVGSLGIPIDIPLKGTSELDFRFYDPNLRLNYKYGFHALAIDERRKSFLPTLWTKVASNTTADRTLEQVEQRWFAGTHGNIGGGYNSDSLPHLPLRWILKRAEVCKLHFVDQIEIDDDILDAHIPDSYSEFLWHTYQFLSSPVYRVIGADAKLSNDNEQVHAINETIDKSVFERFDRGKYKPRNLLEWAGRRQIDLASIKHSVRADNPTVPADDSYLV